MKALVTGAAGHLGEAMVCRLRLDGADVIGVDVSDSPTTTRQGSVADVELMADVMRGVDVVWHTATLHKPHVATHSKQAFIETNVSGTLVLLEAAVAGGVRAFVFTSTTSVYGDAMKPAAGAPAVWVTESLAPRPKNIYGVTKLAAEDLCRLFHRNHGLDCLVLRTSRFFPEEDDSETQRAGFSDENLKVNEFLYRRVDVDDVVDAHLCAAGRAPAIGHGLYIVSATTPFAEADVADLVTDPASVVARYVPHRELYAERSWCLPESFDRVYVNARARRELGWSPEWDFAAILGKVRKGQGWRSETVLSVGAKGYHPRTFDEVDGPYPVG